jgi:hypothetical protein
MSRDDLERRLSDAAEEVRQSTRSAAPPAVGRGRRFAMPGWVVLATVFAAVVLIGVLPLLLGGDGTDPAATTVPIATPTTEPPQMTTTVTTPPCSADGVERPGDVTGLSRQAADVRTAVIDAAVACDFATMTSLAGEGFTTSFGGGGAEMLQEWEEAGEGKLGVLLRLLATGYAVQTFEGDAAEALGSDTLYVWPAAFARDTWEEITDEEMADLLTIYTQEELDEIAGFGSYAGWRTGITGEGDWLFFVAGD